MKGILGRPTSDGHRIEKCYASRGGAEWTIRCDCGWKEKAYDEATARRRWDLHVAQQRRPR